MKFLSFSTKLALVASVATVMTGCDDPEYPTPTPVTTASTAQGRVIVVNAAPGAGDAQVRGIDNAAPSPAIAAIPYLSSSAYTGVAAGQRLLTFGTATNVNNNQIFLRNAFASGTNSTVFLTDLPTATSSNPAGVRTLVLTDNLSAPAVATNAKIRFVNLAPSGTYGIFNSTTNASLFSAAPTRSFRAVNATVNNVTTTFANFTEVPAGSYTLDVRTSAATGTPIAGTQQVITLAAGKIYTLYTRGVAGNATTPLGISVVTHN